jgi:hypothetical protein
MWLFTSAGFISIVQDHDNKDNLLVRASSPFHQNTYMKSRLFQPRVVVRRCHSYGYVAFSRLARPKNPSISFRNRFDETDY